MKWPVSGGQVVFNGSNTNPKFYILGGYSQTLQDTTRVIQIFDPLTKTTDFYIWEMRSERANFVAVLWDSSIVYFGGKNNDSLEVFNFYKNQEPTIIARDVNFGRLFPSGLLIEDDLFIMSGSPPPPQDQLPFIVTFNLRRKEFSYKSDFSPSAFIYSADASVFSIDKQIYLLGGIINKFVSNNIRKFDVSKKSLQNTGPLLNVRAGASATYISSTKKGFIVGGYNETTAALKTVEQIVVQEYGALKVSSLPPMNYARKHPMVASFNNMVFVFGGTDEKNNVVSQIEIFTDSTATGINDFLLPDDYYLEQNYPNPFNPITNIRFGLPKGSKVSLKVYNLLGEEVAVLVNRVMPAGIQTVSFDAGKLASGIYVYRFESDNYVQYKKMILMK